MRKFGCDVQLDNLGERTFVRLVRLVRLSRSGGHLLALGMKIYVRISVLCREESTEGKSREGKRRAPAGDGLPREVDVSREGSRRSPSRR
jgi:hypothetical protein